MKTSEILDLAADEIQRVGWGQGPLTWANHAGSGLCLEGAIAAAAGVGRRGIAIDHQGLWACPAYSAVAEFLDMDVTLDEGDMPHEPLWQYNDRIAESAEDVIAVLRAAAAVERVKESTYSTEDQPLPVEMWPFEKEAA